ncbi:hypothetical protein [Brevibacillus dissolubilis]|nr:hypothetical protein [Brevibacillus dissolubilis]
MKYTKEEITLIHKTVKELKVFGAVFALLVVGMLAAKYFLEL